MSRHFSILLIVVAVYVAPAQAQIKFAHLETDIGLDNINALWRDTNGYLWIGNNRQGLMRYNSYETTVFNHQPKDTTSLSDNTIYTIFQDSKNRLWIGTRKGLNRAVPQNENFVHYLHKPSDPHSLPHNTILGLFEDQQRQMWIVTDSSICRYNEKTDDFSNYAPVVTAGDAFQFCSLVQDHTGRYWVASNHTGIYEFLPETGQLVVVPDPAVSPASRSFKSLYVDSDNRIWICSRGEGLTRFDPTKKTFTHFSFNGDGTGTNGKLVHQAIEWGTDYLLVGVDQGGVNVLNKTTGTFTYIKGEQELSSDGVYTFHYDKEGILWVGTSRGGINYFNPKKNQFKKYHKRPGISQNSLPYNLVGCFTEDSQGMIWIGTDGGGIGIFNPQKQTFTDFSALPITPPSQYSIRVVRSMSEDKAGNIWIATWNEGLWVYNRTTRQVRTLTLLDSNQKPIKGPYWSLKTDSKNRFWLTLPEGSVYVYDSNLKLLHSFASITGKKSPLIHEFKEGIFLTNGKGIFQWDEQKSDFRQVIRQPEVIDMEIDQNGYFYVASIDNGLYVYNAQGRLQNHYLEENGLPSRYLHSLKLDQAGHLWISSINGLIWFDRKYKKFRHYDKEDGIQGNQFFLQSSYRTRSGQLFFGGIHGFTAFYPSHITPNTLVPPVYINGIKLLNKPLDMYSQRSRLQQNPQGENLLSLLWNESMITFEFVGINFTNPNKNQYAYKLENFDNGWIYTDASRRYATYTNLLPGTYVFRVRVSNNSGVWNPKEARIIVIVKPPFWRETWFYILMAAVFIASVYGYMQWSKRKLQKDKELLTLKVAERTRVIQQQHNLLDEKNKEMEVQKTEIQSQNEELMRQNEILQEQRDLNAYKSLMIQDLNQNLEKRIQEKTQELTLTIQELNKTVSELDRFIYSASHELSAPLKSILGLVYLAQKEPEQSEEDLHEYLSYIERYVLQLEDVMKALVEFSRNSKSDVKLETISLYKVSTDTIEELRYMPGAEKTEFQVAIPEDITVPTDFIRLKMILNNLISNSIKYRDTHKEINWLRISYEPQGEDRYCISVTDNGIGIEPDYKHKVFDMFFRATEVSVGTGLGLYIVKECVQRLHGEIKVDSKVGEGTSFHLYFPK